MPVLVGNSEMEEVEHDYRKYLDPKVLARIGSLELRARMIVEGFFMGMHHSPHHGASVEFAVSRNGDGRTLRADEPEVGCRGCEPPCSRSSPAPRCTHRRR